MAEKSTRSKETELTLERAKEQLIELGKKRGNMSYDFVADKLSPFEVESDQIEEF